MPETLANIKKMSTAELIEYANTTPFVVEWAFALEELDRRGFGVN